MAEKTPQKDFMTTAMLSLFVGSLGVDRFYLGKVGTGILKLITFGGFGVWYIIDIILTLTGSARSKDGQALKGREKNLKLALIITAVAAVLWVILSIAVASSSDTTTTTTVTQQGSDTGQQTSQSGVRFADRVDQQSKDVEIVPGEAAVIDGVKLTVNGVTKQTSLGDFYDAKSGHTYVIVDVTLQNTSGETKPYNAFDFRIQTAGGQVLDGTWVTVDKPLSSGDLVQGGSVSGQVVFEAPVETGKPQYIIWKPSAWKSDRAIVQIN